MPFISLNPATAAAAPVTTAGAPLTSVGETVSTMQTELADEFSGRTDVTNARLLRWLNLAYRSVWAMLSDLRELDGSVTFSFVADQPLYLVPKQVAWFHKFSVVDDTNYADAGGIELRPVDIDIYRGLPDLTDEPRMFVPYGRMYVLYPTPVANRTAYLDFRIRPDDLVNSTDSPLLPVEFHEVIMMYAKARGFRVLRLYKEQAEAENEAVRKLQTIVNTSAEVRANTPSTMTPIRTAQQFYRSNRF